MHIEHIYSGTSLPSILSIYNTVYPYCILTDAYRSGHTYCIHLVLTHVVMVHFSNSEAPHLTVSDLHLTEAFNIILWSKRATFNNISFTSSHGVCETLNIHLWCHAPLASFLHINVNYVFIAQYEALQLLSFQSAAAYHILAWPPTTMLGARRIGGVAKVEDSPSPSCHLWECGVSYAWRDE